MFFSYSIRNFNARTSEILAKYNVTKNFRRNTKGVFSYCRDLKMSWLKHFPKFNKREVWNKNVLVENFLKIKLGATIRDLRV